MHKSKKDSHGGGTPGILMKREVMLEPLASLPSHMLASKPHGISKNKPIGGEASLNYHYYHYH
jgi:hypothetical protein